MFKFLKFLHCDFFRCKIGEVLSHLPKVSTRLFIRGNWEEEPIQQEKSVVVTSGRVGQESWVQVHADQEYTLKIELERVLDDKKVVSKLLQNADTQVLTEC